MKAHSVAAGGFGGVGAVNSFSGGFVRMGLVHINTEAEVDAALSALDALPNE